MEITFDPCAEAVYIRIAKSNTKIYKTREIQKDRILIDIDRKGNILGIEVLWVQKLNLKIYPLLKIEEVNNANSSIS